MRIQSRPALGLIRAVFRGFERLAPELGSRAALRVWCTVPRSARQPVPVERPAGGERFVLSVDGRNVAGEVWGTGPTVYLVHGWGGRGSQFDSFVTPLTGAGYRVVSFDALGHGDSAPGVLGGRQSSLPEFARTLTAVVRATGPAYGVVAHSLGASATALAVLSGLPAERLVLIAAMGDPIAYIPDFAHALGFGDRVQARLIRRMEALSGRPASEFDLPARARQAGDRRLPRLLVVHDRRDKEVRYSDGPEIVDAWPGAQLATTDGLGHRRILRGAEVVDRTVEFLGQP